VNFDFDKITGFLNSLAGLPRPSLVFVLCLCAGWVFKKTPWIHNSAIPLLVCGVGSFALLMISDYRTSAINSVSQFIFLNLAIGFIIGAFSTACYRWALKPLLAKMGVKDENGSAPPIVIPGVTPPPLGKPPEPGGGL
jgi:ABC-type thiamin/hydroxymethylpyrimidine transport system permease subunit